MASKSPRSALVRVAVYYVLAGAALVLGAVRFPVIEAAIAGGGFADLASQTEQILGPGAQPPVGRPLDGGTWSSALLAGVSMLGALAIMVPVTWVYIFTRRHRGYEESVVHTLLILPVAVTGIVMIVKTSIPLAFSLAGIVAAVRFRTTLEDTKDAVYVFLAIGVGVACGDQAIGIAAVLSIVFNAVVLVLWRTQFGNIYADAKSETDLGDVLAGHQSRDSARHIGNPQVVAAAAPADLAEVAERASRIDRYLTRERAKKKSQRANTLLLVFSPSAAEAQAIVDGHLDGLAVRYELAETRKQPDGSAQLEYLARLEDEDVQGALMDRLGEAPKSAITAAELRSLKGLKPRT